MLLVLQPQHLCCLDGHLPSTPASKTSSHARVYLQCPVSAESTACRIPTAPHPSHISVSKSSCLSLISSVGFINSSTLMGNFCLPPKQTDSVCCLRKPPARNREVRGTILPDLGQGKSLKTQTVTEKNGNPVSQKDCKN